jgi:ethanolamine ammonia-lyase small subunit
MDGLVITNNSKPLVDVDPWEKLRQFTNARIALGRVGNSQPTAPLLAFNLAHAQARDAVHRSIDAKMLHRDLQKAGFDTMNATSAAPDRAHYLRRPDLGRKLSDLSVVELRDRAATVSEALDVVFVVADGLSSLAAERHAVPFLKMIVNALDGWSIGPVVIASQSRVALGDGIGEILGAKLLVVLIGERPGLSSPDSLGIYLTYQPRVGRTDAERNCISNVRPEGLTYQAAAVKLLYLLTEARRLKLTGVTLKEDSDLAFVSTTAAQMIELAKP